MERGYPIDALITFATSSTEDKHSQRVKAINALIILCREQESQGFRHRRAGVEIEEENTPVAPLPGLSDMLLVEYISCILLPTFYKQPVVLYFNTP